MDLLEFFIQREESDPLCSLLGMKIVIHSPIPVYAKTMVEGDHFRF